MMNLNFFKLKLCVIILLLGGSMLLYPVYTQAQGSATYEINTVGAKSVYQGHDLYFFFFGNYTEGTATDNVLAVTNLPSGITASFPDLEKTCCTRNGTYWTYGSTFGTLIKITVPSSVPAGDYSITLSVSGHNITKTLAYPFKVKAIPTQPVLPVAVSGTPAPLAQLSQWEAGMKTYGTQHCTADGLATWEGNAWYYDGGRVYYQIKDYTNDPKWEQCAKMIVEWFRDSYIIPNGGSIPGWRRFTDGMLMEYQRNGTQLSKDALIMSVPSFNTMGYYASWETSREVSYGLSAMLNAQEVGWSDPQLTKLWLDILLGDFDQWFVSKSADYVQPFMVALAAESLIKYYEKTQDPIVFEVLLNALEILWNTEWHVASQSFLYESAEHQPGPAPDLNLLIAPAYGWLYKMTGDTKWRDRGDQIFNSGVVHAYLGGGKQFSQNYRWSPQYVKWRNVNYANSGTPPVIAPPAPLVDTTPPIISSVAVSGILETGATISWITDEPSDTQVEYGITDQYGSVTVLDTQLVKNHTATLSSLLPNTVYTYRVKSRDSLGNLTSSVRGVFNTLAAVVEPRITPPAPFVIPEQIPVEPLIPPTPAPIPTPAPTVVPIIAPPTPPVVATSPVIRRTLAKGMTNSDVAVLQDYLKKKGFLDLSVETTLYFGNLTEAAVKKFQQARNIETTGIVGPLTQASIASNQTVVSQVTQSVNPTVPATYSPPITLRSGMQHSDVVRLQNILKRLGFFPTNIESSGTFGPVTKKAVQYFQRVYKIASSGTEETTGYGMVGQKTWAKLLSL